MNDLNTKEVSDICVACGMCCDGTMFEKANLSNPKYNDVPENIVKAHNLNMNVFEEKDKFFFKLPCHLFDKCCTVYEKIRPRVCGTFFCEPLRKFEKDIQSLSTAENQINTVLKLKGEMINHSKNFEIFNDLNWAQLLLKLDEIILLGNPFDLKIYGLLILKLNFFKNAKKLLYTIPKQD